MSYMDRIGSLLIDMHFHFRMLNDDDKLTEADKKQLKDFYLQNFIAPKARKLLEKYFPEEFGKAASAAGTRTIRTMRSFLRPSLMSAHRPSVLSVSSL